MKRNIIYAVLLAMLMGCATQHQPARSTMRRARIVNVNEYEQSRARLYDAALNFLLVVKNAHDNNVNSDWCDISKNNREVIENYRVPNLGVLMDAIEQLENREMTELADSYDDELCEYYQALNEYKRIVEGIQ